MVFLYFYYTSHTMEMDISKLLLPVSAQRGKAPLPSCLRAPLRPAGPVRRKKEIAGHGAELAFDFYFIYAEISRGNTKGMPETDST